MAKKKNVVAEAEKVVKHVLERHFKQNIDAETIRTVAQKVSATVPESPPVREQCALDSRRLQMPLIVPREIH